MKKIIKDFEIFLSLKNFSDNTIKLYTTTVKNYLQISRNKIDSNTWLQFIKKDQEKLSASTIRTRYTSTKKFLTFLKLDWFSEYDKELKLPKDNPIPKEVISMHKVQEILDSFCLNKINQLKKYLWIRFLFESGVRISEFRKINKYKDIDYENKTIKVFGKGNKKRIVFLSEDFIDLIKKWPFEYFAVGNSGVLVSNTYMRKVIKTIGRKFNIDKLAPHMLRRSFCTHLIKNNCGLKIVQNLMGHSNIATTSRYIVYSMDEMYVEYKKCFLWEKKDHI